MSRKQLMVLGGLLLVGGISCFFFPLFHVRPLDGEQAEVGKQTATRPQVTSIDPSAFVSQFWGGPLRTDAARTLVASTGSLDGMERNDAVRGATEIAQLWLAFDSDKAMARSQYGRQAGLGGAWYFYVRGQGIVETVEKQRVFLSVATSARRVCLELGVVVDNTVREAIGVKASQFANAQDFNAVSSELNRRVEQEVIAPSRQLLQPGVIINFRGAAKISRDSELDPLCLVPVQIVPVETPLAPLNAAPVNPPPRSVDDSETSP